jgi:predicted AAA+ superfamily ATPase
MYNCAFIFHVCKSHISCGICIHDLTATRIPNIRRIRTQSFGALLGPRQVGKTTIGVNISETTPSINLDLENRRDLQKVRDIPQLGPRIPAETLERFWTMLAHN